MQAYAACDDPEVREAMRTGYGKLHLFVETVSGLPQEAVAQWFAKGMLLNVVAAMDLSDTREPWARRLVEGAVGPGARRRVARRGGRVTLSHLTPYVSDCSRTEGGRR